MTIKDKLQEYALIAEIIGGMAIVGSLIFVGLQIRQNAEATEISAYQLLVSQITDLNAMIIQDTALALVITKARNNEPLDVVEGEKFFRFSANLIRHGDMVWQLYQRGVIDEQTLQNMLGIILAHLAYPAFREIWEGKGLESLEHIQGPGFRAYVEQVYLERNPAG